MSKGRFALNIVKSFIKQVYVAAQVAPVTAQGQQVASDADADIDVITVS